MRISQVDKSVVLLTVPNPNYEEPIHKYSHLHGEVMDDNDKKSEFAQQFRRSRAMK